MNSKTDPEKKPGRHNQSRHKWADSVKPGIEPVCHVLRGGAAPHKLQYLVPFSQNNSLLV
jgi:hypothetical protein